MTTWQEIDLRPASDLFDEVAWDDPIALAAAIDADLSDRVETPGFTRHLQAVMPLASRRRSGADEPRTIQIGCGLLLPPGSPVLAPRTGTVIWAGQDGCVLEHEDGLWSRWIGLTPAVLLGASVTSGHVLGMSGGLESPPGIRDVVYVQCFTSRESALAEPTVFVSPSARGPIMEVTVDPVTLLGLPATDASLRPTNSLPREEVIALRAERLAKSQRAYFKRPPNLVRSRGVWFYDEDALGYLDLINNVTHVGHANPSVVAAATRQLRRLNTNSRFMYEGIATYAKRLTDTMPDGLDVVLFVCTGSEANDLALRISRQVTNREDVVVIDGAYHGNTTAVMGVSPNRYKGTGGRGAPPTTHEIPTPDRYRGPYRYDDPDAGAKYAADARAVFERLAEEGRPPAAVIAESLMGTAGNIVFPPGYLASVFEAARSVGAFCISDEVQVGVGRFGNHFWGFMEAGVVPDFVTMGKPLGNGHPVAAVITTRAIADAFDDGVRYFNTFAGNPVSCAIGTAVLDYIEDNDLQENARVTGAYFLTRLREVQDRHRLIGDVRGHGLYLGIEITKDRDTREPGTAAAMELCELLKDDGVMNWPIGRSDNVLKLKPPMIVTPADIDIFVSALDDALTVMESA